jgi:hypothetical protein
MIIYQLNIMDIAFLPTKDNPPQFIDGILWKPAQLPLNASRRLPGGEHSSAGKF